LVEWYINATKIYLISYSQEIVSLPSQDIISGTRKGDDLESEAILSSEIMEEESDSDISSSPDELSNWESCEDEESDFKFLKNFFEAACCRVSNKACCCFASLKDFNQHANVSLSDKS
jgi:hypothetical protein